MGNWLKVIIWIITIGCLLSLFFLSMYLYHNLEWFKKDSLDPKIMEINQGGYRIYIYHLQLSFITRSIGLISGSVIAFLGLASIFYTWAKSDNINIEASNVKAIISTASPGLLALIIGGTVLILSVNSKDDFPIYEPSYDFESADSTIQNCDTIVTEPINITGSIQIKK